MSGLAVIGEPALLVNTKEDLFIYILFGGHGVIVRELCEKYFSEIIGPKETVYTRSKGFLSVKNAPPHLLNRAPSKRLRMKILKRDNFRCKVCGRSPANHVDVELHLHHVQPWGLGGITDEENLITLCKTCHDGLYPHFDYSLFSLVDVEPAVDLAKRRAEYLKGITNYQRISFEAYRASESIKNQGDSVRELKSKKR